MEPYRTPTLLFKNRKFVCLILIIFTIERISLV